MAGKRKFYLSKVFPVVSNTLLLLLALAWMGLCSPVQAEGKTKVGFLYTGTVDDHGWNASQEKARKALEENLPWVETSYVESVTEGDAESYLDQMADQGVKVIFTTSPTFMDATIAAAARHPDVIFFNADGYKQAPNVGTYLGDIYQCSYLMGMMAGGLSKTGEVGTVASYPTPENIRYANAFVLGLEAINPKAVLHVKWLNTWADPLAETEATETLLGEGVDFIYNGMDSSTVERVAQQHHVPFVGKALENNQVPPDCFLTGTTYDWGPAYTTLLKQIQAGVITPRNMQNFDKWWKLGSSAVLVDYQPGILLNPRYRNTLMSVQVDDGTGHKSFAYDLIMKRYAQMSTDPPQFEPFTGPLIDANGNLRVPAGRIATKTELFSITWRLPAIVGSWPK